MTGVFPIACAKATAVPTAASDDYFPRITSTRGIFGTGLKKCIPQKFSGRLSAPASFVIEMVEAGRLGQKNGKGFYTWKPEKKGPPSKQSDPEANAIVANLAKGRPDPAPAGDAQWAQATGFGGANFMYAEDNISDAVENPYLNPPRFNAVLSDCHTGGKFVLRYNTLSNTGLGQTHPTSQGGGDDRGCRAHEIYGNVITTTGATADSANFATEYNNSGTALFWGNTIGSMFHNIYYINIVRQNDSIYVQHDPLDNPGGWGHCGTEFDGTGSAWDRNDTALYGVPCIDQPGRGVGDLLTGSTLTFNRVNSTTNSVSWPNIEYYNRTMAKPFKSTYQGRALSA